MNLYDLLIKIVSHSPGNLDMTDRQIDRLTDWQGNVLYPANIVLLWGIVIQPVCETTAGKLTLQW